MNNTIIEIINDSKELVKLLVEKKAEDITILDVSESSQFADIFIIASGQSLLHLHSLQTTAIEYLEPKGYCKKNPHNTYLDSPWVLIDMGDIVIHLFIAEAREFYNLENLWKGSPKISTE